MELVIGYVCNGLKILNRKKIFETLDQNTKKVNN